MDPVDPVSPLDRARKGRQGTRRGIGLDRFGVRVALGAVATARRTSPVTVFLNGSPVAGPPGSVLLTPHLQIVVTCPPGPAPVPASYAFPAGT